MTASTTRRPKKAVTLSADARLLARARQLKLNLSQVFEAGLSDAIRRQDGVQWLRKNRDALKMYNEHVEKNGVFSEGLRSF